MLLILVFRFIVLSADFGPFGEFVLRGGRTQFALELNDFAPQFQILFGGAGLWGREEGEEVPGEVVDGLRSYCADEGQQELHDEDDQDDGGHDGGVAVAAAELEERGDVGVGEVWWMKLV